MRIRRLSLGIFLAIAFASPLAAQSSRQLYDQIKAFKLGGAIARVENLSFSRDRLQMTFTGDFYFEEPAGGGVYGAVFIGRGQLRSESWSAYERESVKRFLDQTDVDATFTKAVLRFTDDTYQKLGGRPDSAVVPADAQSLAASLESRLVRETGLNLSSRLLMGILNKDNPGFFFAEFDGGNHGRFDALVDHQARTPGAIFEVNAGEKGLIFKYAGIRYGNDIWTAFYDEQDLKRGIASYSDAFDVVTVSSYRMNIDLRDPGSWLRMETRIRMTAQTDNVTVVPLRLNEGLPEVDDERKKKSVHVIKAELADGSPVGVVQEEWETGVSLLLPSPAQHGGAIEVVLTLEGKDALWSWGTGFHYPRSTTAWYPRSGYLNRAVFDVTYRHKKTTRIASVGQRMQEGPADAGGEDWTTRWVSTEPVALITFVCGLFQRHEDKAEVDGRQIPIEYYSPPGNIAQIKEDFILTEIGNAVRYFNNLFGRYPYGRLGAAYFPTNYGQGFPTLLLLPVHGYADRNEYAFMAHENAHQWWGNIVGWRSYRDQWLSEGFADYSGVLYTALRSNTKDAGDIIKEMRRRLLEIPATDTGAARIKLAQTGPLILGYRLNSSRSNGAADLIYKKGALVLRMLHFLLSNPETAEDKGFFDMMKDFVEKHRNGMATSESFMAVAGDHFARSPIGQKYGLHDLNWFLSQWVFQSSLPNYHLDYRVEPREGGGFVLKGTLLQENVPAGWFMPLPLVIDFGNNRQARTAVAANGPKTPIEIRLPDKPQKVRLDPELWILSEKTTDKAN